MMERVEFSERLFPIFRWISGAWEPSSMRQGRTAILWRAFWRPSSSRAARTPSGVLFLRSRRKVAPEECF